MPNRDKMADRRSCKCARLVTVTKPRATPSKTGVLSPLFQQAIFNRGFMMTICPRDAPRRAIAFDSQFVPSKLARPSIPVGWAYSPTLPVRELRNQFMQAIQTRYRTHTCGQLRQIRRRQNRQAGRLGSFLPRSRRTRLHRPPRPRRADTACLRRRCLRTSPSR